MGDAKHTPGPWEWSNSSYYGFTSLWNSQTRQEVLVPGGRNDGDDPIVWMGEEMSEADKALIAAAPDLVEACKAALIQAEGCFLNHYPGDDPYTAAEPEHIAMLRAALSKAGV